MRLTTLYFVPLAAVAQLASSKQHWVHYCAALCRQQSVTGPVQGDPQVVQALKSWFQKAKGHFNLMVLSLLCWSLGVCKGSQQERLTGIAFCLLAAHQRTHLRIQNIILTASKVKWNLNEWNHLCNFFLFFYNLNNCNNKCINQSSDSNIHNITKIGILRWQYIKYFNAG